MHTPKLETRWVVQSSQAYDALCLLNILTGDSFYTEIHPEVHKRWQPRLLGETRDAFEHIAQVIRQEHQGILSAWFCLLYSGVQPQTLQDLITATLEPTTMLEVYRASPYFDATQAQVFQNLLPDLFKVFQWLQTNTFELEHQKDLGSDFEQKKSELLATLEGFEVVSAVQQALGRDVDIPEIEVFMLAYTAPHGIKIMGNKFITSLDWAANITVRTAIHELMHPPFDLQSVELQKAFKTLQNDAKLWRGFEHHDPAFGYNTWEGYIEENCVRALDQVIAEGFGIAKDAQQRWQAEDGGMHLLAAQLTPLLRSRRTFQESFEQWFIQQVNNGNLRLVD
jgi:hypothetical protein